jgi:hypothetical protein
MGAIVSLIRPFIAPLLMPWLGALFAYIATKKGIVYTPEAVDKISEGVILAVCYIFAFAASISGGLKVLANKKLNRANAATTEMVKRGNAIGQDVQQPMVSKVTGEYSAAGPDV